MGVYIHDVVPKVRAGYVLRRKAGSATRSSRMKSLHDLLNGKTSSSILVRLSHGRVGVDPPDYVAFARGAAP